MTGVATGTGAATRRRPSFQDELSALAAPVFAAVREHPFWDGLCRGTLPPDAMWYFAEQDAHHVVPSYARALARAAALADRDSDGALLCWAAQATFGSLPRLTSELVPLAAVTARPAGGAPAAPGPAVLAYTSFLLAAPVSSFAAAVGGLLPMTWFHFAVSERLRAGYVPGSRYAAWIDQFCAHDGFEDYLAAYLDLAGEVAGRGSAADRGQLVEHFLTGARYELAFADAAWRCQQWAGEAGGDGGSR